MLNQKVAKLTSASCKPDLTSVTHACSTPRLVDINMLGCKLSSLKMLLKCSDQLETQILRCGTCQNWSNAIERSVKWVTVLQFLYYWLAHSTNAMYIQVGQLEKENMVLGGRQWRKEGQVMINAGRTCGHR